MVNHMINDLLFSGPSHTGLEASGSSYISGNGTLYRNAMGNVCTLHTFSSFTPAQRKNGKCAQARVFHASKGQLQQSACHQSNHRNDFIQYLAAIRC